MVVFVVSDVVEPRGGDGVECEITCFIDEILLDDEPCCFRDCLHMCVTV